MKEAIRKSGYLLEQRVEPLITQEGYYVQTNPAYPDPDTGKSREYDIQAISGIPIFDDFSNFIYPIILCECENNSQPVVLFASKQAYPSTYSNEVMVSGIPVRIWQEQLDAYESFSDFVEMHKFHHYCKGITGTQYCTFQLPKKGGKSSWIALHGEKQHDTLNSLVKCLEYEISAHFDDWSLPDKGEESYVDIQIYYPLIILAGSLYYAELKNNRLILRESKHVQFRKQFFTARINEVKTYQIDIIVEEFLPEYLKMVNHEVSRIKRVLRRKRADVYLSIQNIIRYAKKIKGKPKSYRKYLEF